MKPGTFTQIYVHLVFAVRYREFLLKKERRMELFAYISGIATNLGHRSLAVNGYSDHVHILLGLNPSVSISQTVSSIKKSSDYFVNSNKWFPGKFQWQDGYGAFTCGRADLSEVHNYITNQEDHHKNFSFRDEYIAKLKSEDIRYDSRFLFEFFEGDPL